MEYGGDGVFDRDIGVGRCGKRLLRRHGACPVVRARRGTEASKVELQLRDVVNLCVGDEDDWEWM